MKQLKKIISLSVITIFSLVITASAAGLFSITSSWTMLASTANGFDITDSGKAEMDAVTEAYRECDKVKVEMYLEYLNNGTWKTYDNSSWSKTVSGTYVLDSHARYVPKGYWYRLKTVHTAYKGSSSESDTSYSSIHLYN